MDDDKTQNTTPAEPSPPAAPTAKLDDNSALNAALAALESLTGLVELLGDLGADQADARLSAAFALPVAAKYQGGPVISQPNGSFCGPTSIANVLRSYGDANATPDTVLSGTGKCSLGICMGGLTLDELADVTRHATGKTVTVLRNLTRADFAGHLMRANDPARRYVVNFDRGPLFGTEGGHHSPIAGYVAEGDLVLVLDVNERYHPWLVKADRLYEAMRTVDASSGLERGLLLVE